jgi:hypothetical protein
MITKPTHDPARTSLLFADAYNDSFPKAARTCWPS